MTLTPTPSVTARTGPIFVLGAPQSGASALAWALAQHPEIDHATGAGWLTELSAALSAVEQVGRKVKGRGANITGVGHLRQRAIDPETFWRAFGAGIDQLLTPPPLPGRNGAEPVASNRWRRRRRSPAGPAPRRWLAAEADLHRHVHPLSLLFPDAQFVHVVRRPAAAVAAMTTSSRANPQPLEPPAAARRWVEAVRDGLDAERTLGDAVLRVDYDQMAVEPEATLQSCLAFTGLGWHAACIRPLRGDGAPPPAPAVPEVLHEPTIAAAVTALVDELAMPAALVDDDAVAEAAGRLRASVAPTPKATSKASRRSPGSGRLQSFTRAAVPRGERALVVSRGDGALLEIDGVDAGHFPQAEGGVYAGHHPGTSEEAVEHLEQLRAGGAAWLVVPRASFWWFDYYEGFREHLLRHHRVAAYQADTAVVFALADAPQADRELFAIRYTERDAEVPAETSATRSTGTARAELARMFDATADHFVVADERAPVETPAGWPERTFDGWIIASHPALPARELHDAGGQHVGWVLGHVIAPGGRLGDRGPVQLTVQPGDPTARMEEALYELTGRYVCVLRTPDGTRLHLDAGGTLGAVHHTERAVVASTTSLLQAVLDGPGYTRPAPHSFPADRENQFFPGGLTHVPWARRLLPNHHLDLGRWAVERHWPAAGIDPVGELELATTLHRIASGLESVISGVGGTHDAYLGLTAGRDSRVLLACARDVRDAITAFTFDYAPGRRDAVIDLRVAEELARIAGIPHVRVPVGAPTAPQQEDYLFRIGHAGHWGKSADFGSAGEHLKLGRAFLPGFLGGLGRGHYWPGMPRRHDALDPETLLHRMKLPNTGAFTAAMREWLDGLPPVSPRLLLDLLYLEHRGGAWAAAHLYGAAPFEATIVPYASRQVLDAMFRLPVEYRSKKRLYDDLILLRWPELAELPFQALPGEAGG